MPTWFCTFSFNDLYNLDLNEIYKIIYDQRMSNYDYIMIDPSISNEYFYQ